jgi:ABC-type proline/glycine betaine transport system substrate-binding protein
VIGAATGAVLAGAALAQVESNDPIKLTLHDWSGQLINTKIMGAILEEAGYTVDYVQADYIAQFAGLKTGDLTLAMEIWATTGQEALDEAVASGKVVNVGETGMQESHTSAGIDMTGIAEACQFAWCKTVADEAALEAVTAGIGCAGGPGFARILIDTHNPERALPSRDGVYLKNRVRQHLGLEV